MKKESINNFISRYSLGGEVESVKIESDDSKMNVSFISDDKTLLGSVSSENGNFPNGEFGIYTTSKLKAKSATFDLQTKLFSRLEMFCFTSPTSVLTIGVLHAIASLTTLTEPSHFEVNIRASAAFKYKGISFVLTLYTGNKFTFLVFNF